MLGTPEAADGLPHRMNFDMYDYNVMSSDLVLYDTLKYESSLTLMVQESSAGSLLDPGHSAATENDTAHVPEQVSDTEFGNKPRPAPLPGCH